MVRYPPFEFPVNAEKITNRLKPLVGSNLDGVGIAADGYIEVYFKGPMTQPEDYAVGVFFRDLTLQAYNTPNSEEQMKMLAAKLDAAMVFGKALIVEVALSNIASGITQAGKTRAVADYTQKLQNYLATGSLYAAIEELTAMRNDITRPLLGLTPFITDARLDEYKAKIQAFVSQ